MPSLASSLPNAALQSALELAGFGCWLWPFGAERPFVSEHLHDLLGLAATQLPISAESWIALAHPQDRDHLLGLIASITQADKIGLNREFSLRLRHGSGAWAYFQVRSKLQEDTTGTAPPGALVTFRDITLQKQTESALQDSQIRYRALYSTSPLAFILWDRHGRIGEWNRRAEELFGWNASEVIGKSVHQLLIPEDAHDSFRAAVRSVTSPSGRGDYSGAALTKSGNLLYCNWYNVAIRSPQGHLLGILSLLLDVTEEKLARDRVAKSEKTYRTLVETSPDAIMLLALDGRITMANQQAQTLYSLDAVSDVGTRNLRDLLPKSLDHDPGALLIAEANENAGFVLAQQSPMRNLDHRHFDADIAFSTVMDSHGQPSGIVFFARDVTEKLRAARELEEYRKNLESLVQARTKELESAHDALAQIVDASPVPTFVLNQDHEVTHWNRACERIIGASAQEMIGTRNQWRAFYDHPRPVMADLVMTGEMELVEQLYQSRYRRSAVVPGAFEAEDFFPTFKRWLFFTAAPLRNSQGEIIGAIETLQDVSERKEAELALRDAKSIAELAAKTKAEFLANMSHEIRTPMNAVIGLAHLLEKTDLSRKQGDYVTRIRGAGEILLRLINDVLDFSKIEAGRMQLESTDFSLDEVLTNVATVVLTRAQEKGLELHYVVEPDIPDRMTGDSLRLTQVLVNLIGNAIKFTTHGTVTAFFRRLPSAPDKMVLEVDVQDTGIGMTLEQQGRLFQAFSQADTSITRNYGGTGLGLTISKRLVELMGGRIWVTSQPNIGSTFSFQIILGVKQNAPDILSDERNRPHRALVVDDNALARTVLMRLLEKFGCVAIGADGGAAALERIEESADTPFDYVTIDLNMPGMSGLELAENIYGLGGKIPRLVLVTASDTHALEEAGSLKHFYSALNKPITAAQIGELLSGLSLAKAHALPKSDDTPLRGMRALLAEDIPTNQMIATEMLESFGLQVQTADNGKIAVEATLNGPSFDFVLMDMQMPEMDGLEATRQIRTRFNQKQLPIIAMTAHALDEEKARCLAAGMNDFITKPVDPLKLYSVLLRWKPSATLPEPSDQSLSVSQTSSASARHSSASLPSMTPNASATAPASDGLPPLPGIDKVDGLRRMMNKHALYERVLKDFHKRFSGEAALIRAALAAQDWPTAERHAHSTKGLSGSIGAIGLQEASLLLEKAIHTGGSYPEAELQAYERALNEVILGIQAGFNLEPI